MRKWWIRDEKDFSVATNYTASQIPAQQAKSKIEGTILDEPPFNPIFQGLEVVSYTLNRGTPVPIKREYEVKSFGPYVVFLSEDGQTYVEHPESYETLARANQIVKRYLRKHYKKVLVCVRP